MATKKSALLLSACLFTLSACSAPGYIYTDIVQPYCKDMDNTPASNREGRSDTKQFHIPYGVRGLTAVWNSNAIADAARQGGITHLEYCDIKTFSILGGIWAQSNIIVYGR